MKQRIIVQKYICVFIQNIVTGKSDSVNKKLIKHICIIIFPPLNIKFYKI